MSDPNISNFSRYILASGIAPMLDTNFIKIKEDSSAQEALAKLQYMPYQPVLLVDNLDRLTGMITGADVAKAVSSGVTLTTAKALSADSITAINYDAQVWQMLKTINGENVGRQRLDYLPVINSESKPIGLISRFQLPSKLAALDDNS